MTDLDQSPTSPESREPREPDTDDMGHAEESRATESALMGAADGDELSDFEHRRISANVRLKLFNMGEAVRIGRYRVIRRLGAGGMGEVYLCEDPELGRKVALKRVLGHGSPRAQERLRREAQLLAQLSHPNVVQVYEIGTHEGRTFVAMEYVEGETIGAWVSEHRRPSVVLQHFVAAGRGLAAAHAVGIVHRDFKPDNVLVSADGTVRVLDFGLALDAEDRRLTSPGTDTETPEALELFEGRTRLSATGSVVGTVAYMSLEQVQGQEVDARSDQFAFCVALYEALWGQPPFPIATVRVRVEALGLGRPRAPQLLPTGLWRVIRRGLQADPAARWPSMDALLTALTRVPRRRRALLATSLAAGVIGLSMGMVQLGHNACMGLEPAWNAEARDSLERSLVQALPGREDLRWSLAAVNQELDARLQAWLVRRDVACAGVLLWEARSESFAHEHACLIAEDQQIEAFLEALQDDPAGLQSATDVLHSLRPLLACRAPEEFSALAPELATRVEAVDAEIELAHMLRGLGNLTEAKKGAQAALETAETLDHLGLRARAHLELAKVLDEADGRGEARLRYELALSFAYGQDTVFYEILVELIDLKLLAKDEEGARYDLLLAQSVVRYGGDDPSGRARLRYVAGQLAEREGPPELAKEEYEEAIALAREPSMRAVYQRHLGRLLGERREWSYALELYEDSLALIEEHYGPSHPQTAQALYQLASAKHRRGDTDQSVVDDYAAAAEIWARAGTSYKAANTYLKLAELELGRGPSEAATAVAERFAAASAAALAKVDNPSPSDRADLQHVQAQIAARRGQYQLALELGVKARSNYLADDSTLESSWVQETQALIDAQKQALGLEDPQDSEPALPL